MKLKAAITKACQIPVIYPEIEAAVRRSTMNDGPFALAIELARMCEAGELFYREPTSIKTEWPAYCRHAFPRGFRSPKRARVTEAVEE